MSRILKNPFHKKPNDQTASLLGETLEQKVQRATDKTMNEPDQELINEVVEHIQESDRDVSPREIAMILRRRLGQDSVHKQYLALAMVEQILQKCAQQLGDQCLDDVLYHVALVATRTNRRNHPEFPETKRKAVDLLRSYGRRGQHALQLAVRSGGNPNLNLGGIMSFAGGYGQQEGRLPTHDYNHYGHLNHTGEQLGNRFYGQSYQQQIATAPDNVLIEDVNIVISQCYSYIDLIQDLILTKSDPQNIAKKQEQKDDQFSEDVVIRELLNETTKLKQQLPNMLQRLQNMDGPEAETTLIQSLEATDILDNAIKLHAEVVAEAQRAAQEQVNKPLAPIDTQRADSTLGDLITFDQLASHSHAPHQQQNYLQTPSYAQQSYQQPQYGQNSQALTPYQGQPGTSTSYGQNSMASDLDTLARQTTNTSSITPQQSSVANPNSALVLYDGKGQGGANNNSNNNTTTTGQYNTTQTQNQFGTPQNQYGAPQSQNSYGAYSQGQLQSSQSQFPSRQLSKTTSNVGDYNTNMQQKFASNQNQTGGSSNAQAFLSPRYKQSTSFNTPQGSSGLYPAVGQVTSPPQGQGQGGMGQSPSVGNNYGQQGNLQQSQGYGQQNGNLNVTGAGYNQWQQQQLQKSGMPYNQNLTVTGANYSQTQPSTSQALPSQNVAGAGNNQQPQNKNNPFTYMDPVDRIRQQNTPINQSQQLPNTQNSTYQPQQGTPQQSLQNQSSLTGYQNNTPTLQKSTSNVGNYQYNAQTPQYQAGQYQQNYNYSQQGIQTPQKSLQSNNSMGNYPTPGSYGSAQGMGSVPQQQGQFQQQTSFNQPQQSVGNQWQQNAFQQ